MPKFKVEDIKEIIIRADIEVENAEQALLLFKNSRDRRFVSSTSEERHITVNELEVIK